MLPLTAKKTPSDLAALLKETELKEIEPVSFCPPAELHDDVTKPFGDMSEEAFNHFSRQAVRECLRTIEEGLSLGLDVVKIYALLELCITRLCRRLGEQAGNKEFSEFGIFRENDTGYYLTGIGIGTKQTEERNELASRLASHLPKVFSQAISDSRNGGLLTAQVYTPAIIAEKVQQLKGKKIQEFSLQDHVIMNIVDTCLSFGFELSHPPGLARISNSYYVGRAMHPVHPKQLVSLSTYVTPLHKVEGTFRYDDKMAVLHPHPSYIPQLKVLLLENLHLILYWKPGQTVSLNILLKNFSFFFAHSFLYGKGSTWCLEVLIQAFNKYHTLKLISSTPGISLGWRAIITPFLEDFLEQKVPCLSDNPQPSDTFIKEPTQFLDRTTIVLQSKFRELVERRVILNRDRSDVIKFEFMVNRKFREKIRKETEANAAFTAESKDMLPYFRTKLIEEEHRFHSQQCEAWEKIQQIVKPAIELHMLSGIALALDQCRKNNLLSRKYKITLHDAYLVGKVSYWQLDYRRMEVPLPQFLPEAEVQCVKKIILKSFEGQTFRFPIDHVTKEPLFDLSGLSEEEAARLSQEAYEKHVRLSEDHILLERYSSPEGEYTYACYPQLGYEKNKIWLVKAYSSRYPAYLPSLVGFIKAHECFHQVLNQELSAMSKMVHLLSALKNRLEHEPEKEKKVLPRITENSISDAALCALIAGQSIGKNKKSIKAANSVEEEKTISQQNVPIEAPAPIVAPTIHTLKGEDYRVFQIIMGIVKEKVSWKEVKGCLASLHFSITPETGKIYKFKFQTVSASIQKEGAIEIFDEVSKNFHEPHKKKRHNARTPLSQPIINRFRALLLMAGMDEKTVKLKES